MQPTHLLIIVLTIFSSYSFAQPSNDDPCSAIPLTAGATCTFSTYTNASATATSGVTAPGCASYSGGDVWFSVTVPASGSVTIDSNTGVVTDGGMAIYSGTCGSLTLIECDDDDSANGLMSMIALTGQTPGATLWIRMWEYGNNNNGTFDICATDPGGGSGSAPANDDPCSATALPVNAACTYTSSTNAGATATSGVTAPGCASYSGGDVWFTVVVPASGNISVDSNTGGMTDSGMAIYSGTCGSLTLIECDDDDSANGLMSSIDLSGQTPGATLWVRMWEYGNNNNGTFDICATEGAAVTPCGGGTTEDFCEAPATLTQGAGSWSSSTYDYYTSDLPANIGIFCGSIENNSWYSFVATSTTETFNITDVSNCSTGWGIQAEVFEVTTDINGCCTNFTSHSNCFNPGTVSTGTVTATGLTIGNTYMLMVDGWGGDNCDFTVSGWTAIGIQLPVELENLTGATLPRSNEIRWQTITEIDNDYFEIYRSFNGEDFEKIGIVDGNGTSTSTIDYSFIDNDVRTGNVYYYLRQYDFNGSSNLSKTIALNRAINQTGFLSAYPNPTESSIYIEINNSSSSTNTTLEIINALGNTVRKMSISKEGYQKINFDLSDLAQGVYFVKYTNDSKTQHSSRIIKK